VGELNGIISLDLLPMEPIEGVHYIQGDFREDEVLAQLEGHGRGGGCGGVGHGAQSVGPCPDGRARIAVLIEMAVDFAINHMKPEGALVVKLFHGSGYNELVDLFKQTFKVVKPIKPKARATGLRDFPGGDGSEDLWLDRVRNGVRTLAPSPDSTNGAIGFRPLGLKHLK
jgi:23S rRNA U2552 (ribose-2'-O)-methylase RlmE/FtsJ